MTSKQILNEFVINGFSIVGDKNKFVVKKNNIVLVKYDAENRPYHFSFFLPILTKTKKIESTLYNYYWDCFKFECQINKQCITNYISIATKMLEQVKAQRKASRLPKGNLATEPR